jgi:hypothetical protein
VTEGDRLNGAGRLPECDAQREEQGADGFHWGSSYQASLKLLSSCW